MFKGLVYLQVSSEEVPQGELRSQVLVNSAHCIHGSPPLPNNGDFCNAGNKRYYEGESWIDEDDKCISCTCKVTWRELLLTKNRDIFRGYSQEFLMGVWRPVLQITTLSVIKKRRFSTPIVIGPDHIHLRLRAWLLKVVPCLRTHFLVQVKSTFVKVFFCYLMVLWFPWKTYLISGQYETQQINLVISTNLVANDGVKLLGFDQLATLKRQFFSLERWRTSAPGLLPHTLGRERHWGWAYYGGQNQHSKTIFQTDSIIKLNFVKTRTKF